MPLPRRWSWQLRAERRRRSAVTAVVAFAAVAAAAAAQSPVAVIAPMASFAGTWYQLSAYGEWGQTGCIGDATLRIVPRADEEADLESRCRTITGFAARRGRLRAPGELGAWRTRFGPAALGFLPVVWSDFWVLAHDDELQWFVAGGHEHQRLAIYARTIALDEAAVAQALARARAAGFDVERLTRTAHDRSAWRESP
jgi:apolipoprotein D and lipocalin family protein